MTAAVALPAPPEDGYTLDNWRQARSDNPELRIELAEGSLIVIPSPPVGHNRAVTRLIAWLLRHGVDQDLILTMTGVEAGAATGRIPDLVLLNAVVPDSTGDLDPTMVTLVVEVESKGTRRTDRYVKPVEYAAAGIAQYWRVSDTDDLANAHIDALRLCDGEYERYFSGLLSQFMAYPPELGPTDDQH